MKAMMGRGCPTRLSRDHESGPCSRRGHLYGHKGWMEAWVARRADGHGVDAALAFMVMML